MGFLDDVQADLEAAGGGDYVTGPEKQDLIKKAIPFTISAAERGKTRYNDDAFTLTVDLAGEERLMEFKAGSQKGEETSRDRTFQNLIDGGELANGPVGPVILVKVTPGPQGFIVVAPVGTPTDSQGVVLKPEE